MPPCKLARDAGGRSAVAAAARMSKDVNVFRPFSRYSTCTWVSAGSAVQPSHVAGELTSSSSLGSALRERRQRIGVGARAEQLGHGLVFPRGGRCDLFAVRRVQQALDRGQHPGLFVG